MWDNIFKNRNKNDQNPQKWVKLNFGFICYAISYNFSHHFDEKKNWDYIGAFWSIFFLFPEYSWPNVGTYLTKVFVDIQKNFTSLTKCINIISLCHSPKIQNL